MYALFPLISSTILKVRCTLKKKMLANGLLVVMLSMLCGCASFTAEEAELHDEIFVYDLPWDKTFLRIMDTINDSPDWTLDSTNQLEGMIMVRPKGLDEESAIIIIKRVDKRRVTVELAKESQRVRNIGRLLKDIDSDLIAAS
jgi:hypothetical protein